MKTNSSNGQLTAQIDVQDHKKSGFDLSNNVLGTGKIGRIIPTRALHVMPGDTINADSKVAVQFEPLAVPILANMDVKQEHFYVPYNVVWQNWDKFISDGEKLDYNGVVPSISMSQIIAVVNRTFEKVGLAGLGLPLYCNAVGDDVILDLQGLQTLYFDKYYGAVSYVGQQYAIKDLLKPCCDAIFQLELYTNTLGGDVTIFKCIPAANLSHYVETELGSNKYIKQLMPAILSNTVFVENKVYVPTPTGMDLLRIVYEFYKPFYGIGSNLDYLNYGRITFADFVWTMISAVVSQYGINNQFEETYNIVPWDYSGNEKPLSVLNLRANYCIWYNNYRDILLESNAFEPVISDEVSAEELFVLLVPRQRCWEKDMFTTALDTPATGNVGVPITRDGYGSFYPSMQVRSQFNTEGDTVAENASQNDMDIATIEFEGKTWQVPTAFLTGNSNKETELSTPVNGFSLYALDAAQRAQKWLQKALFFGNRISDFYYLRFGVRFLDARLRLPELLTSSSELVKLDVVMNNTNITTEAGGQVYQSIAGDRAAYASAYDNGNSFHRYCEEHGVIMSYLTIMPQITYAYGCNRDYSRIDQFDFAFSEFATLGMDAVYDDEITALPVRLNLQDLNSLDGMPRVFGYQGKYYDYKAKHSEEHGELLDSQDMYTFARFFNMYDPQGRPKLNYEFVHCFPDLDMFVVDNKFDDYFRYDIRHSTAAERGLPSQSIYI